MPEADVQEAQVRLDKLIADGVHAFNEGRTDEAAAVAESAILSNPSSVAALSLKGMCHERRKEIAEAIEAYEKVVALSPDSALDRIKLNQLRNLIVKGAPAQTGDRKLAAVAAIAAVAVVVCLGALGAALMNRQQAPVTANNFTPVASGAELYGQDQVNPQPAQAGPKPNFNRAEPGDTAAIRQDDNRNAARTGLPEAPAGYMLRPVVPTGEITGELPLPGESKEPITPPTAEKRDPVTPPKQQGPDPEPTVDRGSREQGGGEADPGLIDIRESSNSKRVVGGSADLGTNANGVEALLRTARSQYETGNFAAAAATYERSLRAGADTGLVNQRLGMVYERLGRKDDAVSAYSRAVQALEIAVSKGATSKQRALESSKAALQNLTGGA
ncbi:MAG: tetratricopeptide repeat protein [Fimbriimonas sp.]